MLTMEERGQYITLLALMHQQGRMDEETIRFLVGSASVKLMSKFSQDENGFFYNKRLEEETEKRNKFTESRRNNGGLGGRPSKKKKPIGKPTNNHMHNHMGNHMEDENENVNEDVIIIEEGNKKGYGEKQKVILAEDEYLKLSEKFGRQALNLEIISLENYIVNGKGSKYKDHYLVLNKWLIKRKTEKNGTTTESNFERRNREREEELRSFVEG